MKHGPTASCSWCLQNNQSGNLSDMTVASSQYYNILLCSEILLSEMRHMSELLKPEFGREVFLCRDNFPRARWMMAAYVRDRYGAVHQPRFECGCCEMLVFRVYDASQHFYVFNLYHNTDQEDLIYECLLASMAAVQAEHVPAIFQFWMISIAIIRSVWVL